MTRTFVLISVVLSGLSCLAACSDDEAGGNAPSATGGAAGSTAGAGGEGGDPGAGGSGGTGGSTGTGGTGGVAGNVVGVHGIQAFDQLSASDRDALKQTKVFFMHMSVGGNLVAGYDHWDPPWVAGANSLGFVFDTAESASDYDSGMALGEQFFGGNGSPLQKINMFGDWLGDGIGAKVRVAGMKFCYTDLLAGTGEGADLGAVQQAYASMISAARAANPSLRFFHITTPLQPANQWQTVENNEHRVAFADWLKSTYRGTDIVFDLQAVESTNASGGACVQSGVPVLCDEWKGDDDGHLSDTGSTRAAKPFLYAIHLAATN